MIPSKVLYKRIKQKAIINGVLRVNFLYSKNHRDSEPKNIHLILICLKSLSRYMERLDMTRLNANDIGSRNYSFGGFLLLNIVFLLEIALYR